MKFGASTFFKNYKDLDGIVNSIEYYIPKLELYDNNRKIKKENLNELLDIRYSYDLEATVHAPYYPNSYSDYPKYLTIDLTDMNDKDKLFMKDIIDIAVRLDADIVTIHPGRIHYNDYDKSLTKMIFNLKELIEYSIDSDIIIGLENKESTDNLNLCTKYDELISVVKNIDYDNFGIVFDIGHANLSCNGNQNELKKYFMNIKDYIIHTHIHDNFGIDNGSFYGDLHLCPGNGNIDYNILTILKQENITFNFELFSIEDIINGKEYLIKKLGI